MLHCPCCHTRLSETDIKTLWAKYTASLRSVKTGGRNGGRRSKGQGARQPKREIRYEPLEHGDEYAE